MTRSHAIRYGAALGTALLLAGAGRVWAQAQSSTAGAAAKLEGSIQSLNLRATQPSFKLRDEQGQQQTIAVDPSVTKVMDEGKSSTLESLKVGQRVEVNQVEKGGKLVAETITVMEGEPEQPSPSAGEPLQSLDQPEPAGQPAEPGAAEQPAEPDASGSQQY